MIKRIVLLVILAMLALGCNSDPSAPGVGTATVLLTDAPIDLSTVDAVEVTLDRIVLFGEEGMVDDEDGMQMDRPGVEAGEGLTLNLLDYQDGETVTIAMLEVPVGEYQKVRMYIREAWLVEPNPQDEMMPLRTEIDVPSGKVDVPVTFTVTGGEETEVILDFDAELSVQVNETSSSNKEYILRPVITPTGIVSG
jgi:hypothetical protein